MDTKNFLSTSVGMEVLISAKFYTGTRLFSQQEMRKRVLCFGRMLSEDTLCVHFAPLLVMYVIALFLCEIT